MPFDYNKAPDQFGELIPDGTMVVLRLNIRPGGVGEDGLCKRSKDGSHEYLDCEFSVIGGEYAKRKFWDYAIINGSAEGYAKAADGTRGKLKAILESARNV